MPDGRKIVRSPLARQDAPGATESSSPISGVMHDEHGTKGWLARLVGMLRRGGR